VTGGGLRDQRVVILGAGSSAIGISDQLVTAMVSEGATPAEARAAIWLLDSEGLVHNGRTLEAAKQLYAKPLELVANWQVANRARIGLHEVVRHVHPTILLGTSAQTGAFTESIVRTMAQHVARPIVFPLSNPTSKSEATPADLLAWTDGRALVATGSPFPNVVYGGRSLRIGQCNNAFIFPGVGLGIIASGATRVTDEMFVAAARALSLWSPARQDPADALYPHLDVVQDVARDVAVAVGVEAQRAGLAPSIRRDDLVRHIKEKMWEPRYLPYRRASH
jgi:malate dehydrogenase (oxaloacetate-decarboxylating)